MQFLILRTGEHTSYKLRGRNVKPVDIHHQDRLTPILRELQNRDTLVRIEKAVGRRLLYIDQGLGTEL